MSVHVVYDRTWNAMDFDLGALPRFPRVSPPALVDPEAPLDPGPGASRYGLASVTFQPSEALRLIAAGRAGYRRRGRTLFAKLSWGQRLRLFRHGEAR